MTLSAEHNEVNRNAGVEWGAIVTLVMENAALIHGEEVVNLSNRLILIRKRGNLKGTFEKVKHKNANFSFSIK